MGRKPCCDKEGLKKGPWTPDEDQKLIDYINNHGPSNWRTLPTKAGLQRCGKSCRLRWANYLRPDIKRGKFSFEEEDLIIQLHNILGNRWSAIAARLPGRTDNEIKNYYNTHIKRRLLRMGIDPMTHGPRLDHLDLPSLLSTLQNSQLLDFPAVLHNLQNLLNPELLNLATTTSLSSSSQNEIPNPFAQNPYQYNNTLVNNFSDDQIHPMIHHTMPSSSNGLLCSSAVQNPVFSTNNLSNQSFSDGSSFATALSSLSSSPSLYPLDSASAYTFLNSNTSNEDEIDSYFMVNNVEKKLGSPYFH